MFNIIFFNWILKLYNLIFYLDIGRFILFIRKNSIVEGEEGDRKWMVNIYRKIKGVWIYLILKRENEGR